MSCQKPGLKKSSRKIAKQVLYMIEGLQNKWISQQENFTRLGPVKRKADTPRKTQVYLGYQLKRNWQSFSWEESVEGSKSRVCRTKSSRKVRKEWKTAIRQTGNGCKFICRDENRADFDSQRSKLSQFAKNGMSLLNSDRANSRYKGKLPDNCLRTGRKQKESIQVV